MVSLNLRVFLFEAIPLLAPLFWPTLEHTSPDISVSIPLSPPSNAPTLSRSLLSFSIEQDRWVGWIGPGSRNEFFFNVLSNLKDLSGEATRLRIGADSEDVTNFNSAVKLSDAIFPPATATDPYPEALNVIVGNGYYQLASLLPSGTKVIWGVNLKQRNVTAASLQAKAIVQAFSSSAVQNAGVMLQAIEIGNEPDRYKRPEWTVEDYVKKWTLFATNVSATIAAVSKSNVPLLGAAFSQSTHNTTGFSPQSIFELGILNTKPGSQISSSDRISQHHYICACPQGVLQDVMSKPAIRGNLSQYSPDIAAVHAKGLTYILGETNSYPYAGAPHVSDTAGAALWALDYTLFASQLGIERIYFHEGIGFKHNFIQPVTLRRSIYDGSALPQPLAPHIQPQYYAAIIIAEAIGPSNATQAIELDISNSQVSGYAFFDNGHLKRAVLMNLNVFVGNTARGSVHVVPSIVGYGWMAPTTMTIKRLTIPFANSTSGVTWGGQTYETFDGKVQRDLVVQTVPISHGVDIHDTEAIMLIFS